MRNRSVLETCSLFVSTNETKNSW